MGKKEALKEPSERLGSKDPDVKYWIDQFRKASMTGLTGQDIYMISRNVLTAKERGLTLAAKANALARRLGIDPVDAERILTR